MNLFKAFFAKKYDMACIFAVSLPYYSVSFFLLPIQNCARKYAAARQADCAAIMSAKRIEKETESRRASLLAHSEFRLLFRQPAAKSTGQLPI